MSTFKRAKVVMLPTNQESIISLHKKENRLYLSKKCEEPTFNFTNQHLYILSDEEIKGGDWIHCHKSIGKVKSITGEVVVCEDFECNLSFTKKIIATTDSSLTINATNSGRYVKSLPQPSQSFISKYVEKYNKEEQITEVMVEFEDTNYYKTQDTVEPSHLKINSKDNTITIKPVKDSWNREEVEDLCRESFSAGRKRQNDLSSNNKTRGDNSISIDEWIKTNL